MSPARIVGETRRPTRSVAPPSRAAAHRWAAASEATVALYVEARAAREVERSVETAAAAGKEAMGLLLGDRFDGGGGSLYTVAQAAVTAPQRASSSHVRFDPGTFAALAASLEALPFEAITVGWYHSHLGAGCFMSPTDEATQRRYFALPHQVGWVLDPVLKASCAFRIERGKLVPRLVLEFDERTAGPAAHRTPRRRPR